MNDFRKLKIPKREKLEVQITDGTEEHNIVYIITSLSTIKGDNISKNFRLYAVRSQDNSLDLVEKHDDNPDFNYFKETRCGL